MFWRAGGAARLSGFVLRELCTVCGRSVPAPAFHRQLDGTCGGSGALGAGWEERATLLSGVVVSTHGGLQTGCEPTVLRYCRKLSHIEGVWSGGRFEDLWWCLLLCLVAHLEEELDRAEQASLVLPLKDSLFKEKTGVCFLWILCIFRFTLCQVM